MKRTRKRRGSLPPLLLHQKHCRSQKQQQRQHSQQSRHGCSHVTTRRAQKPLPAPGLADLCGGTHARGSLLSALCWWKLPLTAVATLAATTMITMMTTATTRPLKRVLTPETRVLAPRLGTATHSTPLSERTGTGEVTMQQPLPRSPPSVRVRSHSRARFEEEEWCCRCQHGHCPPTHLSTPALRKLRVHPPLTQTAAAMTMQPTARRRRQRGRRRKVKAAALEGAGWSTGLASREPSPRRP
mmetsp:Transcript_6492/g.10884  ORF Transcript_6492/g.10884 Transcript_6492/m.10884 type:complete len:242 (-) Transcript_6492:502-1227(-)